MTTLDRELCRRLLTDISEQPQLHQGAIELIVKRYRRFGKWIKVNGQHLGAHVAVSAAYTMGVVGRVLELSGHRLGDLDQAMIDATGAQVMSVVPSLLPLDAQLRERLAAVPWLAQPALLDVLVEDVFDESRNESKVPKETLFQAFVLVWVAVEVLSFAATPPADG